MVVVHGPHADTVRHNERPDQAISEAGSQLFAELCSTTTSNPAAGGKHVADASRVVEEIDVDFALLGPVASSTGAKGEARKGKGAFGWCSNVSGKSHSYARGAAGLRRCLGKIQPDPNPFKCTSAPFVIALSVHHHLSTPPSLLEHRSLDHHRHSG